MSRGFTFIQLSMLLMVGSLITVAVLPAPQNNIRNAGSSVSQLNEVLTALRQYEAANGALPCPADASKPTESDFYGVAASNPGASGNCSGGAVAANYVDSVHHVAVGMVPLRPLGLPNSAALDRFGRTITYAVDTNATTCFAGTLPGQIALTDNGTAVNAVALLLSHGTNGHGAWIPLRGSSGTATRLNAFSSDADELLNAHVDTAFTPTTPLTGFVRKPATPTFDDLVVYKTGEWSLNTAPAAVSALLPTMSSYPGNGNYITAQVLSFVLTFPQSVTVTGTPRLALTVGSRTDYAAYASGSGTTALTFSYTIVSADYAPGGIAVATPIDLNGGSIAVAGGSAACLPFTPPDLTKVYVNVSSNFAGCTMKGPNDIFPVDRQNARIFDVQVNPFQFTTHFGSQGSGNSQFNSPSGIANYGNNFWIADTGNNRIVKIDDGPSWQSSFGSAGTGNGKFNSPTGVATDSSGNIYVVDQGNSRVQVFTSSGTYSSQFGSAGSGNGQFSMPQGIVVDSSGNIYVVDQGNSRVEKFNSSGVYQSSFGSAGSGTGQFSSPTGIAVDSSGNVYVGDTGNNRIEKFNSSGTYVTSFGAGYNGVSGTAGAAGSGNGQLSAPMGVAVDGSGHVFAVDSGNDRLEEFNSSGTYNSQTGSYGTTGNYFNF